MAETRWYTLNHHVPRDGVPPDRMYAQAMHHPDPKPVPQAAPSGYSGPPNGGLPPSGALWGPPPPAYGVPALGPVQFLGMPAPAVVPDPPKLGPVLFDWKAAPAPAPSPHPPGVFYEPPGQYVDGHIMRGDNFTYITAADNATIYFLGGGVRPCDWPNGQYNGQFEFSRHRVPCSMTVKELMIRLGCPDVDTKGLTEMRELRGNRWAALDSFTRGGAVSARTLEQVGWTKERDETNPIWLVVKR